MMPYFPKYDLKQIVYLKTDEDMRKRIVTGIEIREGHTLYELSSGTEVSHHYDFEITRTKTIG